MTTDMFPACAGMNRCSWRSSRFRQNVPRVCGDEPKLIKRFYVLNPCSPRVRG